MPKNSFQYECDQNFVSISNSQYSNLLDSHRSIAIDKDNRLKVNKAMQAVTKIDKTIKTFRFKRKNKATMRENRKTVRSINIKNAQLSPWFFRLLCHNPYNVFQPKTTFSYICFTTLRAQFFQAYQYMQFVNVGLISVTRLIQKGIH